MAACAAPALLAGAQGFGGVTPESQVGAGLASPPTEDVWRRVFTPVKGQGQQAKGLGKTAWLTWNGLPTPMSTAELAAWRRVSRRTAQRSIAVLARHGLAGLNDDGRYVKAFPPLDELAAKLGTIGAGAAQQQRHKLDRAHFEEYVLPHLKPSEARR